MTEPGVYRSDTEGHLFVLSTHPVCLTCIICVESCSREDFKNNPSFKTAAELFVSKHGYLDEKIADKLIEIVPPRANK